MTRDELKFLELSTLALVHSEGEAPTKMKNIFSPRQQTEKLEEETGQERDRVTIAGFVYLKQ